MKKITNIKNQGFSTIEILLVVIAIGGLVVFSFPTISKIKSDAREANRFKIVCLVENAKDKFDQDSKVSEKRSFDSIDETQRFEKLQPTLGVTDPLAFFKNTGIVHIKVNKLGLDVETTTQEDIKN